MILSSRKRSRGAALNELDDCDIFEALMEGVVVPAGSAEEMDVPALSLLAPEEDGQVPGGTPAAHMHGPVVPLGNEVPTPVASPHVATISPTAPWVYAGPRIAEPPRDGVDIMKESLRAFRVDGKALAAQAFQIPADLPDAGTVAESANLEAFVLEKQPGWRGRVIPVKLAIASLAVYELHLTMFALREHVQLVWIIEGGEWIRAHAGTCYLFQQGAWVVYEGLVSDVTLARVKRWRSYHRGRARLAHSVLSSEHCLHAPVLSNPFFL